MISEKIIEDRTGLSYPIVSGRRKNVGMYQQRVPESKIERKRWTLM